MLSSLVRQSLPRKGRLFCRSISNSSISRYHADLVDPIIVMLKIRRRTKCTALHNHISAITTTSLRSSSLRFVTTSSSSSSSFHNNDKERAAIFSSSLWRDFRQVLNAFDFDDDKRKNNKNEDNELLLSEETLQSRLQQITEFILYHDDKEEREIIEAQYRFSMKKGIHHLLSIETMIPTVIRMWLAIYQGRSMERAWWLWEYYLQLLPPPYPPPSNTSMTEDESSTPVGSDELLNLILYNWKARWITRRAFGQTPRQLLGKLQQLVILRQEENDAFPDASFKVPLTAFHTLLQAVARDIVIEQASQKIHGISFPLSADDEYQQDGQQQDSVSSSPSSSSSIQNNHDDSSMFESAAQFAESILTFLQQHSQQQQQQQQPHLTPTPVTYNLVMEIWSRSRLPQAPTRVEELLQYLIDQQQQQQEEDDEELSTTTTTASTDNVPLLPSFTSTTATSNLPNNNYMGPTTKSFHAAIAAWAYSDTTEHSQAADRAVYWLRHMIDRYHKDMQNKQQQQQQQQQESAASPAAAASVSTNTAITATASERNTLSQDAPFGRIEIEEEYDIASPSSPSSSSWMVVKPIPECFALVIWVCAKQGMASQAQALFEEQYQMFQSTGDADFLPTVFGMNALMQALTESTMKTTTATKTTAVHSPSAAVETTVVPGIVAEQLISFMEMLAEQTGNDKLLPNIHTYRNALMAWVKSCNSGGDDGSLPSSSSSLPPLEAPARAEAMLRRMLFYYQSGLLSESPGVASYGMMVDAWCKAGEPERAEALLAYLYQQWQEQGLLELKPTRVHYHMVMNAWSKSNNTIEGPHRATRLLEEMKRLGEDDDKVQPDSVTYFLLLNMWAKSQTKEGQNMVETLLKEMREHGMKDTADRDYFRDNDSSSSSGRRKRNPLPGTLHYNTLLNSLAKAGDAEAADDLLRQQFSGGADKTFEPDAYSYNTVLQAWSKSRREDAPERAQALFDFVIQRYEEVKDDRMQPTVQTYTTMMTIHGNSKKPGAIAKAEALFEDMRTRFEAGATHLKADVICCTAMLNAWSKAGMAEQAEAFLLKMIETSTEVDSASGKVLGVVPNTRSFATVMAAWANSNDPRAAFRAEQLLRGMQELHNDSTLSCRPDTVCYNSTLQAWTKCLRIRQRSAKRMQHHHQQHRHLSDDLFVIAPEEVFEHVVVLMAEMMHDAVTNSDSSATPDLLSFKLYLSALERCSPAIVVDRAERAQNVFLWMKQLGVVPNTDLKEHAARCSV